MVGKDEFYVRVGGILQTKSAFLGHVTHDPAREHIEARQRIDSQVEEYSRSYDHSFDLPMGALLTVLDAVKQQICDDAIAEGATPEEAKLKGERFTEEVKTEQAKVEETAEFVERSGNETIEKVKTEIGEAEVAKLANKQPVSPKTCKKVGAVVSKFKNDLIKERDRMNLRASMRMNPVEEASLRTRNEIFNGAIAKCDAILTEVGEIASNAQTEMRDLGVNAKLVFGHPVLAAEAVDEVTRDTRHQIGMCFKHPGMIPGAMCDLVQETWPETRGCFEHPDMIPGAACDLVQKTWRETKRDVSTCLEHPGMIPEAMCDLARKRWRETKESVCDLAQEVRCNTRNWYNRFKRQPIETTANTSLDVCTLFVGGSSFKVAKECYAASFAKNLSRGLRTTERTVTSACERALKSNDGFLRLGKPAATEARAATTALATTSEEVSSYGLLWTSWNQYPKVVLDGTTYAKIGNRLYTEHAVGRTLPSALGRNAMVTKEGMSISPNLVEHVIRFGESREVNMPTGVTRTVYSSGTVEVYTENNGNLVVTVNSLRGKGK